MPSPATDTPLSIPESGPAPKRRIPDAKTLLAIHEKFREDDEIAAKLRAVAQALIDGERPYDPEILKERGQEDKINLTFGEAKGELDGAMAPYAEIIDGVNRLADVKFRFDDPQESAEKSEIVSEHFDWMLKQWDELFPEVMRLAKFRVRDGISVAAFRDERSWQWDATKLGDWLTDRDTAASDQKIEVATIYKKIPVSKLYDFIRNKEAAKAVGWNPRAVREAIWKACRDSGAYKSEESHWEEFQRQIKEHDPSHTDYNKVSVVYGYVREFDGKYSWLIGAKGVDDLLLGRFSKLENINNGFVMFANGVGEGTIHTVRGLAHDIYNTITVSNRVLCEMLETALAESRVILRGDAQAIQDFQFQQIGNFSLIDKSFEPVQLTPGNSSDRVIPAYRMMAQIRQNNTGQYQSRATTPEGGQARSATEVRAQMMNESSLNNMQMTLWYQPYSRLLREMYRRAVSPIILAQDEGGKLAKEFVERCRRDGVSIDELRDFENVTAVRAIGNGSPSMRNDAADQLLAISSGLDEKGKLAALREKILSIQGVGYHAADRFLPKGEPRQTVDHQLANIENALFRLGQPAVITGEQNHVAHLSAHFPFLLEVIEAIKAGQLPPEQALPILRPATQNATEHVLKLSENAMRQVEAGEMRKRLQNVTAFVNQLDQQVTERMLKEQRDMEAQSGEQPDPRQTFELQKMQLAVQEQQEKARGNRELHDQRMEQIRANMALTDLKAARSMAVESAKRPVGRPTLID